MRILVTGANGLVGRRLCALLAGRGHDVIGLGRGPLRATLGPRTQYVAVELTDASALTQALETARPQTVIHCAAMTDVDGCEKQPSTAWAANVDAVATLARAARTLEYHLVHVSTDYVFDGNAGPYDVDAIPHPRGAYAISKHAGEEAVRVLCPASRWTIARTAVVYGWPSAGKNNFGSWLIESLKNNKPVKLFVDQFVSPSHAGNVAEMLAELGERQLPGIWHTSGADIVDRVTFGKKLCAAVGFNASLIEPSRMADVNLPSPRPAKSGLIVTKTAQLLEAKPMTLDASLLRLHSEYKENPT